MMELCPRLFPAFARFVVCGNITKTKEPKRSREQLTNNVGKTKQISNKTVRPKSDLGDIDLNVFKQFCLFSKLFTKVVPSTSLVLLFLLLSLWFLIFSSHIR